jgi:hypothetical protein
VGGGGGAVKDVFPKYETVIGWHLNSEGWRGGCCLMPGSENHIFYDDSNMCGCGYFSVDDVFKGDWCSVVLGKYISE